VPSKISHTFEEGSKKIDRDTVFRFAIDSHLRVVRELVHQEKTLQLVANALINSIRSGGKILWCGNGGSAADCQHLAAEFVGRFRRERDGLPSIALTTDTSVLTAIGNDYGFNEVFRRQVKALCTPRDVVIGISTSGSSKNVILAMSEAKNIGATAVCFTGSLEGELANIADVVISVASRDTARIQEAHILAGHILCDWVETALFSSEMQLPG